MKSLTKGVAVSVASLFMGACGFSTFPEFDKVRKGPLFQGITAQELDDTQGTIKNAIIYAPFHDQSGSDTIAEVHVGSVRACFMQMVDAASVNTGSYRVDCVGPPGNIVARFATEAEEQRSLKGPRHGEKKGIYETQLTFKSDRLP
jgi:hypothetical protein